MSPDPIIDEIYEARIERGMSLRALAESAGVPASSLSYWERGARSVTLRDARLLAAAMGFQVALLRDGDVVTHRKEPTNAP